MVSDADGGKGLIKQLDDQFLSFYMPMETTEDWDYLLGLAEEQTHPPELVLTHQTQNPIGVCTTLVGLLTVTAQHAS